MVMSMPTQSIIDTRRHQMFTTLEAAEIERVRRFGKVRSYGAGEALAKVGEVGHGLTIILAGKVDITRRDGSGRREPIVTHSAGAFMGELAQLAGRRSRFLFQIATTAAMWCAYGTEAPFSIASVAK